MSRRSPEIESALGLGDARERLASTLRDAGDAVDSPSAGLLEVSSSGLPAAPVAGAGGRRRAGGPGTHAVQLREGGDTARAPLSTRLRVRTGVRAAALVGVLAAVLAGCFWFQAGTGGAQVVALSGSAPAVQETPDSVPGGTITAPAEDASAGPENIEVHVAGAVHRPGVVQLPAGSRLHDAIAAAGGAKDTADPDRLNLAAVLEDGQKVVVPIRGGPDQADATPDAPPAPATGTGSTRPGSGRGKINLNTASLEELGTLPRVGPVLAQRIVDWRQQHGRYKTVQELDAVDGIGPKLLEALLPLVGI